MKLSCLTLFESESHSVRLECIGHCDAYCHGPACSWPTTTLFQSPNDYVLG
jgi:hypothetical protein